MFLLPAPEHLQNMSGISDLSTGQLLEQVLSIQAERSGVGLPGHSWGLFDSRRCRLCVSLAVECCRSEQNGLAWSQGFLEQACLHAMRRGTWHPVCTQITADVA